jgi:hypothetical protein
MFAHVILRKCTHHHTDKLFCTTGDKGVNGTVGMIGDVGPKGFQGEEGDKGVKGGVGMKGLGRATRRKIALIVFV